MRRLKLYGHEDSGHAYKVALALSLSKLAYEYERVDIWASCETRPKTFQDHSRWCEVPLLMVDDEAHIQSGAILMFLAQEFGLFGGLDQRANEWILWEANRIGMCLPQLIQAQKTPNEFPDGALSWLKARLEIDDARLSEALKGQDFLLGKNVSIADIAIFGYLSKVEAYNLEVSPIIRKWITRIENLPHFQTAQSLLA